MGLLAVKHSHNRLSSTVVDSVCAEEIVYSVSATPELVNIAHIIWMLDDISVGMGLVPLKQAWDVRWYKQKEPEACNFTADTTSPSVSLLAEVLGTHHHLCPDTFGVDLQLCPKIWSRCWSFTTDPVFGTWRYEMSSKMPGNSSGCCSLLPCSNTVVGPSLLSGHSPGLVAVPVCGSAREKYMQLGGMFVSLCQGRSVPLIKWRT